MKAEGEERKREEAKAARADVAKSTVDEDEPSEVEMSDGASLVDDDEEMDENVDDSANPMAALLAAAQARAAEYDQRDEMSDEDSMEEDTRPVSKAKLDPSSRAFSHLFQDVLSSADILLYVLDARDPLSTRSIPTERQIVAYEGGSKTLILILNKIDLVPPKVLKSWHTYLNRYHPTLLLRASKPASNAKVYNHKELTQERTSRALLNVLKRHAEKQNLKRAQTVGIIGYPNVGKSSVINVLTAQYGKSRSAVVGAEAGVTTALQKVKLDNKLLLLDSPGVVYASTTSFPEPQNSSSNNHLSQKDTLQAQLILLNALPPKSISDPIPAITLLLSRLAETPSAMETVLQYYGIPALMSTSGDITTDFLVQVARKRGRLGKGGVPNLPSAAMTVLGDWRDGRISGWVEPPSIGVDSNENATGDGEVKVKDTKVIVDTWGEEFKIDGLWGATDREEGMDME